MPSNENIIQDAICQYLTLKRYFFWRSNTTGLYDPKTQGFRRMPKYAIAGVPDIIIISDGFFIGLEVKDKGKQSDNQKAFEENCTKAGGVYAVVRSVDDVIALGL